MSHLLRALGVAGLLAVVGCSGPRGSSTAALKPGWSLPKFDFKKFEFRAQTPAEDDFETKSNTPFIGDYTTIAGLNVITLQGVGLVHGLDGTGGDPPPSVYRTALLDDMRRRGVKSPNQILRSPNTALVVVRAYLPPLIKKRDRFDVEVRLPGNSGATSLNGGWLMETLLTEHAIVPGRGILKGHVFAKAAGPILVAAGSEKDADSLAGVMRRGRIPGGGISVREDRDLVLYLRNEFRSVRNAKRISNQIGKRFFAYNRSNLREALAKAKTDRRIELKVQPLYRDNFPRYLQVIRSIAFKEDSIARRVRIQRLKEELNSPATSEKAALRLEAIGRDAVPILKSGLKNRDLEVRFHAATALAYLGEPDGLKSLAEAAANVPAFRVYALAAMSVIEDAASNMRLRELMNGKSAETRYGAFRSLTTLDPRDPFVVGEDMNGNFRLHVLDTTGPPMIHLTKRRKSEVVLFGARQQFTTPIALRAGKHIMVTAQPGADSVIVSRYQVGRPDQRKIVSTRVADVIRTVAGEEFGASYPEVAQMLAQAANQGNLPGRVEIDTLPTAGRLYVRRLKSGRERKTKIGTGKLTPNLFGGEATGEIDREPEEQDFETELETITGRASLQDVRKDKKNEDDKSDEKSKDDEKKPDKKRKWYDPLGIFGGKQDSESKNVSESKKESTSKKESGSNDEPQPSEED